uniref:Uncharacterized protein n=1 Tax=Romanomermis culicivorax TaxID=13658 RepID=A0A915JQJ4_ROMCU
MYRQKSVERQGRIFRKRNTGFEEVATSKYCSAPRNLRRQAPCLLSYGSRYRWRTFRPNSGQRQLYGEGRC